MWQIGRGCYIIIVPKVSWGDFISGFGAIARPLEPPSLMLRDTQASLWIRHQASCVLDILRYQGETRKVCGYNHNTPNCLLTDKVTSWTSDWLRLFFFLSPVIFFFLSEHWRTPPNWAPQSSISDWQIYSHTPITAIYVSFNSDTCFFKYLTFPSLHTIFLLPILDDINALTRFLYALELLYNKKLLFK